MANYTERLYTLVDKETLRLFNSKRLKEGVGTYAEYLRLIVERYVNSEPETNKLVSRDRVSQNYVDLYTQISQQSKEIKLLTSTILVLTAMLSQNTDNPVTEQTIHQALQRATVLEKDNDEIGPAAIDKMMRDVLGTSSTSQTYIQPSHKEQNTVSTEPQQPQSNTRANQAQSEKETFNPNVLTVSNFNHKLFRKQETKDWWKKVYDEGEDEDTIDDDTKRRVVFYETSENYPAGKKIIKEGYDSGQLGVEWINGVQAIKNDLIFRTTGTKPYSYVNNVDIDSFLNRWSDKEGRCILPEYKDSDDKRG